MRPKADLAAQGAISGRLSGFVCPLSQLEAGAFCRVKRLSAPAEMCERLREIGFCEEQIVRRLASPTSIICQVCQARLAVSAVLAELIWVEPLNEPIETALCA